MASRKKLDAGDIGSFIKHYARMSDQGDPNDRRYDRKVEKIVKKMDPQVLDELINGNEPQPGTAKE